MKINAQKHAATFEAQKHLNNPDLPPAGSWQAVIRAIGERKSIGNKGSTLTTLYLCLGNPLKIADEAEAERANAIAGKARVKVDMWHPSDTGDQQAEQRWSWLLQAVRFDGDVDLEDDASIADALVGRPLLVDILHRKRGDYTHTLLKQVGPCTADVSAKVLAMCGGQVAKGADRILRREEKASSGGRPAGDDDFSFGGQG